MEKQDALDQLQQIQVRQEKRMEYYYDLIRNGEELTPTENSNAKKLFRKGYADSLEKGKAIVRRNRDLQYDWNDWFYRRYDRTPDEEVETTMNKCKYFDCGWCYAPDDVKTNATQSGCFEPEHCPYLKSQMTENKKSFFVYYLNKTGGLHDPRYLREMIELLKEWLPDEIEYEYGDGDYDKGWNDALCTIKDKLR